MKKIIFTIICVITLFTFVDVYADFCDQAELINSEQECVKCDGYKWDVKRGHCISNLEFSNKVTCGNITGIPKKIPELTSFVVTLIQVAVPVVLVIMGSIDLFKGVMAQKEDEMKKGRQTFIKRLIVGVVIFFIVAIVKFIVTLVDDSDNKENMISCIDCFLNNVCTFDYKK